MSRADALKEGLGWRKVVFAVAAAIDVPLIAWLAQNHDDAGRFIVTAGLITALIVAGFVGVVNYQAYRHIRELENL